MPYSDPCPAPPSNGAHSSAVMALLCLTVFMVALGYASGLPLLQLYLAPYLGDTAEPERIAWHVGMLGGVYMLALFAFAPWWGRLSDRRSRTLALTAGFAAFLAGSAGIAMAGNLWAVYGARLLAGAGAAAILPTAQAYIADVSAPDDRSRRLVLLGSSSFLGFLAGPAVGTWIAGPVMGMTVGQTPRMVNWPPLAMAIVGLPVLVLIVVAMGRSRGRTDAGDLAVRGTAERRRFVFASMVLALLAAFSVGTFEVGFNVFGMQTLGLTSSTIAIMFIICSLAMLAAQSALLLPAVRRRIDQRWLAAAFAVAASALALASLVSGAASLGLLIIAVGVSVGIIAPVVSYELLERDHNESGLVMGRQAAATNLGQALGSFGAGLLFALHPVAPFWAAALALALGACAALTFWGPARNGEIALEHRSPLTHSLPALASG